MFRSMTSGIETVTLTAILVVGLAAPAASQAKDSGFLPDYSRLENKKDPLGVERRIWISPKLTRDNHQKALVEPVSYYPKPEPNEKVSMGSLNDIRDYTDSELRTAMASALPLTNVAGPGVERQSGELSTLTLAVAKPQIDEWAETVRQALAARIKPAGQ